MDPLFGVGIYSYLFENFTTTTTYIVRTEIQDQVKKYMPFIAIEDLKISEANVDINQFYVYIKYSINALNALQELSFVISK